jgi:lysophospholipid acyltransferase (LPLAT)-like uncharacterized protein
METVMPSPPPDPSQAPRPKKSSGVVVPHAPRWDQRLAAWLVFSFIRSVSATVRYKLDDRSGFFDGPPPGPAIYCVWHNRLALCLKIYYGFGRPRNPSAGLAAMVSASKDGAFLAAILERFKVQPVRGSSSRRGPQALLELTTWAERGYDLAITPDGPRGPCYVVQEGIMSLAQITGLPILPASYRLSWKYRPKSWDRFQIPLPFTRCEVRVAKPIRVPRDISAAEREQLRLQLETTLKDLSGD